MPAGAEYCAGEPVPVVVSIAELWHRVHTMPYWSQEAYLFGSLTTPPERLTTPKPALEFRSQVIPGNDSSGSFPSMFVAVLIVASLVQPVVWHRAQEYEAPALLTRIPPFATQVALVYRGSLQTCDELAGAR
jgi:hypothetical protein